MLPFCANQDVAVIPWSLLAHGRLTQDLASVTARQRSEAVAIGFSAASKAADRKVIAAVAWTTATRGVQRAQVALAWLMAKPVVTAPIVGVSTPEHLNDAIAAFNLRLAEDEIAPGEAAYTPHTAVGFA